MSDHDLQPSAQIRLALSLSVADYRATSPEDGEEKYYMSACSVLAEPQSAALSGTTYSSLPPALNFALISSMPFLA